MTGMQVIENGRIVDSSAIVPISTINDVTASRSITGTYINNTGKTLYVIIATKHQANANTSSTASFRRFVDDVIVEKTKTGFSGFLNQINLQLFVTTFYVVPPGSTHLGDAQIQDGLIELLRWTEIY